MDPITAGLARTLKLLESQLEEKELIIAELAAKIDTLQLEIASLSKKGNKGKKEDN